MVDTVVVQSATTENKEDPKHIEAMIAKVDAAEAAASGTEGEITESVKQGDEDRPEWLPEKFKSPADMAKAYAELEAKLGSKKEESTEEAPNASEETPNPNPEATTAENQLSEKGLDINTFVSEYETSGALSEDSYAELAKAGFSKELVDNYVRGQVALSQQYNAEITSVAGGDDGYKAMCEWAKANATPAEIKVFNEAVTSGNVDKAKLAVAGMSQKYKAAQPDEPALVTGDTGTVTADVYESIAQLQADMSNPLYKTDPAYRNKVHNKLDRSDIL